LIKTAQSRSPGLVQRTLAKHTPQIAARKEDCPRPAPTPQAVFLAHMWKVTGHPGAAPDLAEAGLVLKPVHVAVTRTAPAFLQPAQSFRGTTLKFTRAGQGEVGWMAMGGHD
jgi:hypothetical protein